MSSARLLFHIGLEKTGSTSFQKFCGDHRALLRRRGTLYPANSLCANAVNHAPFAASYFSAEDSRTLLIAGRRADRREAVAALKREIEDAAPQATLVSAEHFSSRFSPERIDALAADFADRPCEIAVVVRDHAARALSAYATTIASGRSLTLNDFVAELCQPGNLYLRYRDTLAPWENAFGRVRVLAYRERQDIVAELAEALLPAGVKGLSRYWLNASDSAAELERTRQRNAVGNRLAGLARRLALRLRGQFRHGPESPESRPQLDENQRRRLEEIAAPDRAWLLDRYGVRLG